jgi:hypothetical protein
MFNNRTYTLQSSASLFQSPYPQVPCDAASIESQNRSIDSIYYLEKTAAKMQDALKMIEHMIKLRKTNDLNSKIYLTV